MSFIEDLSVHGPGWLASKQAVNGQTSRVRPPSSMILAFLNTQNFSAFDASSFRQIFQTPFTGPCAVRAWYETDATTTSTVDAVSLAAGRSVSDLNPLNADGSAASWTTTASGAVSLSAASASVANDGLVGFGASPWALLNIPAPTDGGLGGYVYVGTKLASGTGRCMVGNAGRPVTDWPNTINTLLPNLKSTQFLKSGGDYVTANQNSFPTPTTNPCYYMPCSYLEIVPVNSKVISGINAGDSTTLGLGTGTPLVQPIGYSWANIAANSLNAAGSRIHIANFGYEGRTSLHYLNRFNLLLNDPSFAPTFAVIQPFSVNDSTFSESLVPAGFLLSIQIAKALKARGTLPILRTVIPSSTATAGQDAVRTKYNDMIRSVGFGVYDLDSIVTAGGSPATIQAGLTYDGIHLNRAGNEAAAPVFETLLRNLGLVY